MKFVNRLLDFNRFAISDQWNTGAIDKQIQREAFFKALTFLNPGSNPYLARTTLRRVVYATRK